MIIGLPAAMPTVGIAAGKPIIDAYVAPIDPTKLLEPMAKSRNAGLRLRIMLGGRGHQDSDPLYAVVLPRKG